MMASMTGLLAAFGLASAAGLNAYLPLFFVGLAARFTGLITLESPWNSLEHPVVLAVLGVLLLVEITVDKIPAVDTFNDVIQTVFRPAAGAVLFAASGNIISDVSPVLAMICGLIIAGGVHTAKTAARPVATAGTMGMANPAISLAEDVVSGATTVVAVLIPILLVIPASLAIWWFVRRRRKRAKGR